MKRRNYWSLEEILILTVLPCATLLIAITTVSEGVRPPGPSAQPEAYFNGSSYVRLSRSVSLHSLAGVSFRSCVGGELFSQRYESHTLQITALFDQVVAAFVTPQRGRREFRVRTHALDNRWHFVGLEYDATGKHPQLSLTVDSDKSVVIANWTFNTDILSSPHLEDESAVLIVGNMFSGCMREGPGLLFQPGHMIVQNVAFGPCPLTTDECKDRKDVLTIPPVDHCYHEPCMRHGTCISRLDRYECHCAVRYAGNNCQIDNGPPCLSLPCKHASSCEETKLGDYVCHCAKGYHGTQCELEISVHPLCVAGPCRHNGSCDVAPGTDYYVCTCQPGYTGKNCEQDVDECADTPDACNNGGRCIDGPNNYTCDCSGTGYEGARCESNVDECERDGAAACTGHGVCYDTYGGYVCQCDEGYDGKKCQITLSACASLQCANGGTCSESETGATCLCPRGFTGPKCRRTAMCRDLQCPVRSRCVDAGNAAGQAHCVCEKGFYGAPGLSPNCTSLPAVCLTSPCHNGGTCTVDLAHDNFNCTCAPGYHGVYCEQSLMAKSMSELTPGESAAVASVLRCADEPCVHASMCHDYSSGYRCECDSGWTGVDCDVKAGQGQGCAARPCHNAAECTDTMDGGYHCHCLPGYTGKQCSRLAPLGAADPCPCQHGGTCRLPPLSALPPTNVVCECPPGYEGALCERRSDNCRDIKCNKGQVCVETAVGVRCRCPDGYSGPDCAVAQTGACATAPCGNGTCKETNATKDNFTCTCDPGYTGHYCESDIDECKIPHICNEGICVNKPGRFQCYCTPGYTGDHCEVDFDECLSHPCKNNGTCQNKINNFECICMPGFTGKDCFVNIDECKPNPCEANSTCIDGVATFSCVCPEGLTGKTCEINIDDCEMMPCQHGGHCTDGRNSYSCDCTGTGYAGPDCRDNIDDCAPDPCRNGATCVDAVNDYHCACYSGYTGKNCEIDIPECESSPCQYNGVCLERSNASLYVPPPADPTTDPVQVGDEPNMLLPHSFYTDFSYENASGLECVCVNGVVGSRCEINVNECESTPCGAWGTCVDRVGRYECECRDGFEGDHCQIDIDECDRYKPCFHGNCYDRRASYYCECEAGWGGHNCSVALVGCVEQPCLNGGACRPWLQHETTHRFNCTCEAGYHGTTCEKITTMSLSGHSYVAVNTTRDEGYDIQFRFRTTIGNGLLAIGKGLTYYILELVNGRLNLHSSLLNKWEGVFIGSNLADSKWQKVFVTINSSHLVLAANEEQTIYPINLNEGSNSSHTSFPTTFLGGTVSSLSRLTHGPSYFVGCMQDVTINGEWVLPDNLEQGVTTETPLLIVDDVTSSSAGGASWLLHSINASCSRTPQCDPNPCHSSGTCQDLWTAFRCTCQRPYLGHTCQYNLKSATFGHESTRSRSVVTVAVYDAARKAVRSVLDISMFIRTRQPTGHIFYIGSKPRSPSMAGYDETSVAASLVGGELVVHLRFNQTPEDYTVGGTRLDNGYDHLIQVMRNSMLVQVKLNGTEYFRKSISAARQLDAQVLYLGGPPPLPLFTPPTPSALPASAPSPPVLSSRTSRVARSISSPLMRTSRSPAVPPPPSPAPAPPHAEETVTAPDATVSAYSPADFFKGIIQDVQVSNGSYSMFVEFFPLQEPDLELPAPFGAVSFDPQVVLEGVVSDDSCAALPCRHNGTCKVTWNDYRCICPRGYKGKSCDEMEFCQLQDCPVNSVCRNLDGGYECLANATFDGRNTTLMYKMDVSINVLSSDEMTLPSVAPRLDSLLITYRSKTGGTLFHASYGSSLFSLGVYRDQVTVQWRLGGGGNAVGMAPQPALPQLRRFNKETPDYQWTTIHILIADSQIKGGFYDWQKDDTPAFTAEIDTLAWLELITRGNIFLGGVGTSDARGPIDTRLANASQDALSHRSLYSMDSVDFTGRSLQPELVTETGLYEMSGESKWNYDETLGESFKGCIGQVRIGDLLLPFFTSDELYVGQTPPPLHNLAHFSLQQSRKTHQYATLGCVLCFEWDCLNGGHCEDITTQYSCKCPVGFAGDNCKVNIDECEGGNAACQNNGTCQDGVGNFTCLCPTGWDGWLCDVNVDECLSSPCAHGGSCVDAAGSFSCICPPQWAGRTCAAPHRRTCAQLPCGPNGNCRDTPSDPTTGNNFTCDCSPGYEGLLCDIPFCLNRLCQHGAQCIADIGEPHCKCKAGYEGVLCEKEIDECVVAGAEPCQHGGRCVDRLASYECDCTHTGYRGVYCQTDVDECQEGLVDCGTGRCVNTNGSYICECTEGYCGFACALSDPCFAPQDTDVVSDELDTNTSLAHGPCQNGGACTQRCSAQVDYECHCIDGWGGKNCTQQVVWGAGGDASSNAGTIAIAVGAALGAALLAGAALAALAANARSKRATRGTYSPSSQEYCNPRLEMLDNALKPPPEERLI